MAEQPEKDLPEESARKPVKKTLTPARAFLKLVSETHDRIVALDGFEAMSFPQKRRPLIITVRKRTEQAVRALCEELKYPPNRYRIAIKEDPEEHLPSWEIG